MRGESSKRGGWITIRYGRTAAWGIEPRRNSRRKSAGKKAVEKTLRGKVQTTFPLRLEIPQTRRDSHFPTASAATGSSPVPPSRFRTKPRALTYDWTKNGGQVIGIATRYRSRIPVEEIEEKLIKAIFALYSLRCILA